MARTRRKGEHTVWPWDEQPSRPAGYGRRGRGPAWLLPAATVAVLTGGYGWLGEVVAGAVGAAIGCLVGLAVSGLLYLLVDRAVSGRPPT
jgi:molybdopterin biosynthesis enzyme